ncbi:MAG: HlyC/CorC family transporter [Actinobacteria bacterium]|nr:HlyC/CorC family transporter [Actinomycetota bacterium]
MSDLWVSIALVVLFILIGSFFAAAEIALVSLRESQVERLAGRGRRGRVLVSLEAQPNRFLAAVQVGVTLAGFISAGFGAAQIAPSLAPMLESWGLAESWASAVAFILVTVVIAYASLVIGELVPKRIALQRTESTALLVAVPVDFLARITRPFIWLLSVSTNGIVRILGGNPQTSKEQITGEELRDIVAAHEELTAEERALIDDVFDAGDRELKEVMIPRTETAFLEASMSIGDAAREVASAPHSRYPVIRGSADNVVGVVHIREILHPAAAERGGRVGDLARQVIFFPGTKELIPALTEMRRQRQHLAIIVDEYGGTAGIVSLEDLVEELIGDIRDEYDEVRVERPTDVDGLLNLEDFAEQTGVTLPDGPYETAAGFVVSRLGSLPDVGAFVDVDDHRLVIAELDGRRIARLRVTPLIVPPAALPE